MSDVKLRPCPGCGIGDEIQAEMVRAGRKERVRCDCGWLGPARDSQLEAAAAWNTRSESPVEKAAGEMYKALEKIAQRANETGTGDLAWQSTVFDMHASARTALAEFDKAKEGK